MDEFETLYNDLCNEIYSQLNSYEKLELDELIEDKQIMQATKFVKTHTDAGLKEAKCVVDYITEKHKE